MDSEYGIFGTVDNKITLDLEDDAARAHMGGEWRMPTKAEFQELINNTYNEWIENFNGSCVNGRKFTSKTDTSNYIFIPAAGNCYSGSVYYVGGSGYVWSSSLNTSSPLSAWYLDFNSGYCCMNSSHRYGGWSVRGVKE